MSPTSSSEPVYCECVATQYLTLSYSYWLIFLQGIRFQSRYLTEELRRIFTEDTDSETEVFEGFTSSEVDVNKKGVLVKAVTHA